jgi:hypothetical protein
MTYEHYHYELTCRTQLLPIGQIYTLLHSRFQFQSESGELLFFICVRACVRPSPVCFLLMATKVPNGIRPNFM